MSKKGENIYKRKDKRWEARYIKGYDPNGSARYGYCYGKTYREAKEKVERAKAALLMNVPSPEHNSRKRFSHYCDEWLRLNKIRVKESTYVKYNTTVEKHIKPKLGGCFIQTLSTLLIEQFTQELLYEEELAPKTVKDILIVLHSILKYSARQYQGMFPSVEIYYPKDVKKEMRVLTKEEQIRFVQYLLDDMDYCKFGTLLTLLTGMRIGEICALRWENISIKDGIIKIISTMQRLRDFDVNRTTKTKIIISDPKSDTSARIIPLSEFAINLCKKFVPSSPTAFVLSGSSSEFIEPRTLQYKMEKYTKDCGLEDVHFHTLRHTFATRCVEGGFEIKSLSEILGHSSPQITLERYVHSSLELKRDNMNKVVMVGCV